MQKIFIKIIVVLLVVLYTYTACSKWFDFGKFRKEMFNQPFAHWLAISIVYTLPFAELAIAVALLFDKSRTRGLLFSAFLLGAFTIYAAVILLGGFDRIPCSCGGFISGMTWTQHLIFTLTLSMASYWSFQMSHSKSYMYNRGS